VNDREVELDRGKRRSERRVDVAGDEDQVGALGGQDRLESEDHASGLLSVAARAHLQEEVGLGQRQVLEEGVRQPAVVVLAGVDQPLLDLGPGRQFDEHGCYLHEIRARADNEENLHVARIVTIRAQLSVSLGV